MSECPITFEFLIGKIQQAEMDIEFNEENPELRTKELVKEIKEIASQGKTDEELTFDQVSEIATMINRLAGTQENTISISELGSILFPDRTLEEPRESKINDSLGSTEVDYEDTKNSSTDFIERVYQNSAVTSTMLRFFLNETIKKIMVDLENNLEILGNSESLNEELILLQSDLYKKIINYINDVDPSNNLPSDLYINGEATINRLDEYFKNSTNNELHRFYNHKHEPQTTLADWRNKAALQDNKFKLKLEAYNSYFILKHFDSMLTKVFGSLILYKAPERNQLIYSTDKYEYSFLDDYNKIVTWQQEDLQQKGAFDLMPKSLQTFIESCEILNPELGNAGTGLYLTKDHITYMVSKIKNEFRSKEYNEKDIYHIKDAESLSIEEIKDQMRPTDLIDPSKLSDKAKTQIAIMLKTDSTRTINGVKAVYLKDIVNAVRHSAKQTIKLVFDVRNALNREFPTTIEDRIFLNLRHYFFNDDHSLYSTSVRMYSQLALLFDTTSVSTYTQYRIDADGKIALIRLNPARITQELNILKSGINSSFVAGECDNLLNTYNVQSIYSNEGSELVRLITFDIADWSGKKIRFKYNTRAPLSQRWTLIKEVNGGTVEFNPSSLSGENIITLSDVDFNIVSRLAKDILHVDLYENKDLRTAFLDLFDNYHEATLNLINCVVPILANIKIFREKPTDLEYIKDSSKLVSDTLYTYRVKRGEHYINGKFYLTGNDEPYLLRDEETKEIVIDEKTKQPKPDRRKIAEKLRGWVVPHKTRAEIQLLQAEGAEFGTVRRNPFKRTIEDWYGKDSDALRVNTRNQGVDLISDRVSKYLEKLVNAKTLLSGATFKTQVRTAENTNLTIGQSSMLFTERFNRLEKYDTYLTPMHILYDELAEGLEGYEISREGVNGVNSKQHKDFNFKENFYSSFTLDFLLPVYGNAGWDPRFTESVNSDKTPVPKLIIGKKRILQILEAKDKILLTLADAYRTTFVNMEDDFAKVQEFYKEETGIDVPLRMDKNFEEFNQWCEVYHVDPLEQLNKMSLRYNSNPKNRANPISFGENVHYHINKKTGKIEMVFSLMEALGRYTLLTDAEYDKRITNLKNQIKDRRTTLKLKFKLRRLVDNLESHYKPTAISDTKTSNVYSWNSKILDIILSNNTQEQLGLEYETFKRRFVVDDSKIEDSKLGGNTISRPYDDFILNSQLQFISDLLKNEVTIDLKNLKGKKQLTPCIEQIVKTLPEYSKLISRDERNIKDIVALFSKLWTTYNLERLMPESKQLNDFECDRMVLGIAEVYNPTTKKYEPLYETRTVEVLEKDGKEEKLVPKTFRVPIQISSRSDLALFDAYDNNNNKVEYYDTSYDLSNLKLKYKGRDVRIKVNPVLEQYNLNSFYWSTLSTFSTVGSHIWSDAKGGTNTLAEECLKWFDNNKRNVIMTATKLQFELGDIWGVPNEVNIAVLDDIIATCSGIMGDTPTVKPYDGATFVNPFMYYWENNSLNQQITGVTKKPIYEFYMDRLMAGGLIKTASFAITNDKIRNAGWDERMMWKCTNMQWIDGKGNPIDVDLTLGLEKGCLGLQAMHLREKDYDGPMYFDEINGKRYVREIVNFEHLDPNEYGINKYAITTRLIDPIDRKEYKKFPGTNSYLDTKVVTIDSNYKFWKALGKYNSCEYNKKTKEFEDSENSIKIVADWAAKVKFRSNKGILTQVKFGDTPEEARYTQKEYPNYFSFEKDTYENRDTRINYCPLKEANIHYLVTKGAIKKYAANVNSRNEYFTDKDLNFFKIRMLEAGIQLDPTHDADLSVVSMMTQVISALSERGYTRELAQQVYEALGELTSLAISDGMKAFETYFTTNDRADLLKVVSKLIVEEFAFGKNALKGSNLAYAITRRLIDEGIRGKVLEFKDIQGVYPFSDPSMFSLLQTTITSALNKKAIKALLYGVLAVLNPSHEIHKMYGTKRLSEIKSINDLLREQEHLPILDSIGLTEIGRTYLVILGDEELMAEDMERRTYLEAYGRPLRTQSLHGQVVELKDSDYYYMWKNKLAGKDYKLKEIIYTQGQEITGSLDSIKQTIKSTNNLFNFFEIYSQNGSRIIRLGDVDDLDEINEVAPITKVRKINLYGRNLGSYNIHINTRNGKYNRYDLKDIQDSIFYNISNKIKKYTARILYNSPIPIELSGRTWDNLLRTYRVNPEKSELWQYIARNFKNIDTTELTKLEKEKRLQNNLFNIKNHGELELYDSNNLLVKTKVDAYSVKKFEAILPKIYATQFGLRRGDSVANVLNDNYFFFKRILENYIGHDNPDEQFYDLCFKRSDGQHVYIKYAANPEELNLDLFRRVPIDKYRNDDGVFRMHPYKEHKKLYPLADFSDEVYYDDVSKKEIIVTKDLGFYLKNLKYTNIEISKDTAEQQRIQNILEENKKQYVCKLLLKRIKNAGSIDTFLENLTQLNNLIVEYLHPTPERTRDVVSKEMKNLDKVFYNYIDGLSKKQTEAFKFSLNFTVARIPAQGMLSFMAMEIVGFNETGVNDCYVSAEQIRLQGSDYDVDKATFMGFAFDKSGCFVKWSPFFQEYSTADLIHSMMFLPYPTGREVEIISGSRSSIDFKKYKDLFVTKELNTDENEEENHNNLEETTYQLKNHRHANEQRLLGLLINEINKFLKELLKRDKKATTVTLTYNYTEDVNLVKAIETFVNKHNTYIRRVAKEEKENLLKNFVSYKTWSISQDPVNSLAGETPVDESAQPFKDLADISPFGTKPEYCRPGNSAILYSALTQNHGGKDVIAIAASTGLKTLHAVSLAYNQNIAESDNIKNLWFDVVMESTHGSDYDKHYNFIADAYLGIKTELPLEEQKQELLSRLGRKGLSQGQIDTLWKNYLNHKEWAGSNESGILTLATDNAKELRLDRLNAGIDLAGLYLYGITIGIPREDIFHTMTSQTAQVLSRLTKGNLFIAPRFLDRLDEAIKFITNDNAVLPKTKVGTDKLERIDKLAPIKGIEYDGEELSTFLTFKNMSLKDTIVQLTLDGQFKTYLERLKLLVLRIQTNTSVNAENNVWNKFSGNYLKGYEYEEVQVRNTLTRLIDYVCAIHEIADYHIKKLSNQEDILGSIWADLHNIEALRKGEKELSDARRLLGLNQGQKTKTDEIYSFYEFFSNILRNKVRDLGLLTKEGKKKLLPIAGEELVERDFRVDFHKFNSDNTYKQRVIDTYNEVKTSINPYWVVTQVPHFSLYLSAAHLIYLESTASIKNRLMIDTIVPHINKVFKPDASTRSAYYKRALNFIDGLISNAFLREETEIRIPAGNKIFYKASDKEILNYEIYDYEVPIELGTREGNETFRNWMNLSVIPGLIREGKLYDNSVEVKPINILISGSNANTFLKDLVPTYSNNTPNRNNILVYTLPIDMIPKSDTEIDQLSKYTIDFYRLKAYKYKVSDTVGYNLTDLFFYYNLINFLNRGGASSLTALFETFAKTNEEGASNRYTKFISNLDTEYDFRQGRDYTEEMLNIALAPSTKEISVEDAASDHIPFLYSANRYTMKLELHLYNPEGMTKKKEALQEIGEEGYSLSLLELNDYMNTSYKESNLPSYITKDLNIKLSTEKSTPVDLETISADIDVNTNNNQILGISISNIKVDINGKKVLLDRDLTISGRELYKYVKVSMNELGEYNLKVNPISLLVKLSTLRRPC